MVFVGLTVSGREVWDQVVSILPIQMVQSTLMYTVDNYTRMSRRRYADLSRAGGLQHKFVALLGSYGGNVQLVDVIAAGK